jgi:hypothetical protein
MTSEKFSGVPDQVPDHIESPEKQRARTIENIKARLTIAAQLLDTFVGPLSPEDRLRKMYIGNAFIVDGDRRPVIGNDGEQEASKYYKLWTVARDFRILEDGRFARLYLDGGRGVTPFKETMERGGDDVIVVDNIDDEFADTANYPQYVLDDLAHTLGNLANKFKDGQDKSKPAENL